jgi:hypothetical protein
VTATWFVNGASGPFGGGIWGFGGLSAEPDGSALYAATGNAIGTPESAKYSERVLRLTPALAPVASNHPSLTGHDVDFGATPVPFQLKGCAKAELAVMNKTGALFVYNRNAIGAGALQRIQMANVKRANVGEFINSPAYDPGRGLLFVANPTRSSDQSQPYKRGLVALKAVNGCTLGLAWQHTAPPPGVAGENSSIPPVVANGVVYYVQPLASSLAALDEASGRTLWTSGGLLAGGVFASPAVANGQLLVVDFAGTVHAFAP